jgi:hypothetical protein
MWRSCSVTTKQSRSAQIVKLEKREKEFAAMTRTG